MSANLGKRNSRHSLQQFANRMVVKSIEQEETVDVKVKVRQHRGKSNQ